MLLGFILGLGAGVALMAAIQLGIKIEKEEQERKSFEEKYNQLIVEEIESFTYDCLNDPDQESDHIPSIN